MEQEFSGRVVVERLAEPSEFARVAFVEVNRLDIELVEQSQPSDSVGSFDVDRGLTIRLQSSLNQRFFRLIVAIFGEKCVFEIGFVS